MMEILSMAISLETEDDKQLEILVNEPLLNHLLIRIANSNGKIEGEVRVTTKEFDKFLKLYKARYK